MSVCEKCAARGSIKCRCPVCGYEETFSPVPQEQPVCPKCGCDMFAVRAAVDHPHP